MGVRWAERKSRKLKNLCIFEKKYTSVFVYWHKGKKNQCFGIDAQVYQNEAHEKVENLKIYAFLKKNILQNFWVRTTQKVRLHLRSYVILSDQINKLNYLILLTEIWVPNSVDKSCSVLDQIVNLCAPQEW